VAYSEAFSAITGREPPASPAGYTEYGLPWFELYDEEAEDVAAAERLAGIEPVSEAEQALAIDPSQVRRINPGGGPAERETPAG
jgi:hypothetical protein